MRASKRHNHRSLCSTRCSRAGIWGKSACNAFALVDNLVRITWQAQGLESTSTHVFFLRMMGCEHMNKYYWQITRYKSRIYGNVLGDIIFEKSKTFKL